MHDGERILMCPRFIAQVTPFHFQINKCRLLLLLLLLFVRIKQCDGDLSLGCEELRDDHGKN